MSELPNNGRYVGWLGAAGIALAMIAVFPLVVVGYAAGFVYTTAAYGFREATKDWSP